MRTLVRVLLIGLIGGVGGMGLVACDSQGSDSDSHEGDHAVVESGTYTGTIEKVKPDEDEIYVDYEGQELELYFTDETQLTRKGEDAEFSALESGQKVEVKVKKVGKRLDPMSVDILE